MRAGGRNTKLLKLLPNFRYCKLHTNMRFRTRAGEERERGERRELGRMDEGDGKKRGYNTFGVRQASPD